MLHKIKKDPCNHSIAKVLLPVISVATTEPKNAVMTIAVDILSPATPLYLLYFTPDFLFCQENSVNLL